jgi:SAM-dependent methyltransferase
MKKLVNLVSKIKNVFLLLYNFFKNSWFGELITFHHSRNELLQYWRCPNDENVPSFYISPTERSELLLQFIKKYSNHQVKILEIGCNVGRNLNFLFSAGYKKLAGIEISREAIDLMKKTYPEMAKSIKIYNSPVEDIIKNFKDNDFDLIFTMATLEHIHPDSEFIFPEIVRITKKYLITIEDEKGVSPR